MNLRSSTNINDNDADVSSEDSYIFLDNSNHSNKKRNKSSDSDETKYNNTKTTKKSSLSLSSLLPSSSSSSSPASKVKFTSEQDNILKELSNKYEKRKDWKDLAEEFNQRTGLNKTRDQCASRLDVLEGEKKGRWSDGEDNLLLDALALLKEKGKEKETFAFERLPWKSVAKFVPNRSGKSCRERYVNHLSPKVSQYDSSPWTMEEDQLIASKRDVDRESFPAIARRLPGRSENNVKNRYHTLKKKLNKTHQPPSILLNDQAYNDDDNDNNDDNDDNNDDTNDEKSTPLKKRKLQEDI